jgi:hypothetical protein
MRSEREIRQLMLDTQDEVVERILAWVLSSETECPFCSSPQCKTWEIKLLTGQITPIHLETSQGWPAGTVSDHMDNHRHYDHAEAQRIEKARSDSISTLTVAEDIAQKLVTWIEELELRKNDEGITSEWVADASRLVGNANSSLRLIGQLKKEIGVDSQLLLAQNRMDAVMGVLVNVLGSQPDLLDQVELHLAALKEPTYVVDDDDWEVIN